MAKSFVKAIPITFFNSAGLTGNLQAINPTGLDHNCFLLKILNGSNTTILISYDGTNDHDVIEPNEMLEVNLQSNSSPNGYVCQFRKGTIVYVETPGGGAGVGIIYLMGYYQEA